MTLPPEPFDEQPQPHWEPSEADSAPEYPAPDSSPVSQPYEEIPAEQSIIERNVEDMTVAELLGQFFRSPAPTIEAFMKVVTAPPDRPVAAVARVATPASGARQPLGVGKFVYQMTSILIAGVDPYMDTYAPALSITREQRRDVIQLGFRLVAFVVALYGSGILARERITQFGLDVGAPFLLLGFILWIAADVYGSWPSLLDWLQRRRPDHPDSPAADTDSESVGAEPFGIAADNARPWWLRLVLAGMGLAFSALAGALSINNQFTVPGIIAWLVSIAVWIAALAPDSWSFGASWAAIKQVRLHRNWTFWVLLLIMILGAYFRFSNLSSLPPEMTSDHVEKLLDSQRILDGETQVFFPNNGGREPIQFYTLAFMSRVLDFPMNFLTLKLLTAFEGMVSILVLWWMGREVIGRDDPKLGNLVGLMLAGLVAVSYWHVALSRLGLRIILTVSFTALLVVFLSRALRYNRRGDYIKAALALGFGLYAYQAVRILPVVIVVGVGMAILFRLLSVIFGRKQDEGQVIRYILNLAVLVIISVAVFVPLLTFSLQFPNEFWRRTSGRLLGDDLIQTTDTNGNLVQRNATLDERLTAFKKNWPILADNIRNALLMYNWKGDVAWINAAPNRPAMDVFTGSLLIVGLAAWLVRMIRRRDVVDWLMPIMLFIMVLPSALSIAYPIENPSATRMSGTLPEAYLFAAFPLALIVAQMIRIAPRRGTIIGAGLAALVILGAYNTNQAVYFGEYALYYTGSSLPYSDAGKVLKGFAESGGDYGNAFMIAYPYWWDHRAIGIEAGLIDWPNGIINLKDTPNFMYLASQKSDKYRLDPEKDLLFFYSIQDEKTERQLKEWFPTGYASVFQSYQPEDNFKLYRVPALGQAEFINFLVRSGAVQ